jgi:uncharacterized protein (TIGR00730 family)
VGHAVAVFRRVCVFCGSSTGAGDAYVDAARRLGGLLAARGIGLVYGGARVGLMGIVADAALANGGEVIGVIPESLRRREIGHDGLTRLHVVGSMHERKAVMAQLADAFVALPGGVGTLEELVEVLTWALLGLHDKPVGLLDVRHYYDDLAAFLDHAVRERFLSASHRTSLLRDTDPGALLDRLASAPSTATRRGDGAGAAAAPPTPRGPLVGTSAIVERDGAVLLGRRRGGHGAGTWSPAGGHVDPGEAPERAAARELEEETGLVARTVTPIGWTNDVMPDEGVHFVTLHHLVDAVGEPRRREPDKVDGWSWHPWDALPDPLFAPVAALRATGWRPPRPARP